MPKKKTYDEVKSMFEKRGYILLDSEYIDSHTKMRYICKKHPNVVQEIRYNNIQQGKGCIYCAGKNKYTIEEVKDYFEQCGYILLEKVYVNANTKMKYQCPHHPEKDLYIRYADLKNGVRCPYCSGVGRKTYQEVREEFQKRGYILVSEKDEYINSKSILRYICPFHSNSINSIAYYNFYSGQGCPHCKSSKGENKIREWLIKNKIKFEQQYKFDGLKEKRLLSYDFYIPDYNILIEYQGQFHDGTVHKMNPHLQKEEDIVNQQRRDELKRNYAKEHNYQLLEIWYWDYDNVESILEKELKQNG